MTKIFYPLCIAVVMLITGCGNSFFDANNYLTGPVDGVGLKHSTSIVSGGSEQLYAVVTPVKSANRSVIWTSSNPADVAVDSNGVITSLTPVLHGTTKTSTITVTTVEGSFSAQCLVTVVEKPTPVTGITLNKSVSYLLTGNSETLSVAFSPVYATNQNITWSSSDTFVASVTVSGVVTAQHAGTAIITATSADGGFTASCQFTVSTTPVPATGITLNKTGTTIATGYSEKLFATIEPSNATDQNINWTTDNAGVATVDSLGNVTGVSVGSATIKATAADGGFFKNCTVSVVASLVPVTGVSLSSSAINVSIGNQSQLSATISPANATNQNLSWSSSNSSVASVDSSGLITGLAIGSATITVTTQDGGFSRTCAVTVAAAVTYLVTYDGNGNSGGTAPASQSYVQGATVVVKGKGTLSNSGYTFAKWTTNQNGTGTVYLPGDEFSMGTSAVTLYAQWTAAPTYTVTYVPYGSSSGTAPGTAAYATGETVTVSGVGSLRGPHLGAIQNITQRLIKWNTQYDGGGTDYYPGATFPMGTANVILFPVWTTDSEAIGKIGEAGGFIFYTNYDNVYMEAAPFIDGVTDFWEQFDFNGADQDLLLCSGTTFPEVGRGFDNTQYFSTNQFKDYYNGQLRSFLPTSSPMKFTGLTINGHTGWFLPSDEELNLMYENLKKTGLGDFRDAYYWSSTWGPYWDKKNYQFFTNGSRGAMFNSNGGYSRAARRFMPASF